ncbi:hypothetical protein [Bacteroides sp.]
MSKLSYRVSYYVLYAMFAIILIVLGIFYFGGQMATPLVPDMSNPAQTDALLYLMYVLFGVAVAATVVAAVFQFGTALKDNPMGAVKSLLGLILLVAVLVVSWVLGSSDTLSIPGYEGTDNVPFWLKLTDMFLYSIYFLFAVTVLAIIGSSIKKKLS